MAQSPEDVIICLRDKVIATQAQEESTTREIDVVMNLLASGLDAKTPSVLSAFKQIHVLINEVHAYQDAVVRLITQIERIADGEDAMYVLTSG